MQNAQVYLMYRIIYSTKLLVKFLELIDLYPICNRHSTRLIIQSHAQNEKIRQAKRTYSLSSLLLYRIEA